MHLSKCLTFGHMHPCMNRLSVVLTMTMKDHFHPPFSDCVRVTTRGQKPALILYSLKRPGREGVISDLFLFKFCCIINSFGCLNLSQSFSERGVSRQTQSGVLG